MYRSTMGWVVEVMNLSRQVGVVVLSAGKLVSLHLDATCSRNMSRIVICTFMGYQSIILR